MPQISAIVCLLMLPGLAGPLVAGTPPSRVEQEQIRGEVSRLIAELDGDQFEVRRRAAERLKELIAQPEWGRLLSAEFQRVLIRPDVSFEVRWHLERWSQGLPEVPPEPAKELSPEQLDRLLKQLDDDSYSVRLGAERRLRWLLLQDEHLPRVKEALQARLASHRREISQPPPNGRAGAETETRLEKLLELARPAMVAEYWQAGRHLAEQHLLIGVPSMSEGAVRPSHFDRMDDEVAHCVSGNNLSPGEYPVGVAFPHPNQPGAFFQLVNLPTPRRRLAYREYVKTDEAARLAALSRRTLDRILAEQRVLGEPDLIMLGQLDSKEVSRFAGKYFSLVRDSRLPPPQIDPFSPQPQTSEQPSRFGVICAYLAEKGTKEAAPGLLEAIDKGRFLPPTSAAPYRYHWLAALAIATRDPWPQVDPWLAGTIPRADAPAEGRPDGPELGATAAAILLKRHGRSPAQFNLQSAAEPLLMRLGIDGYRFPSAETRKNVQQWWETERARRLRRSSRP